MIKNVNCFKLTASKKNLDFKDSADDGLKESEKNFENYTIGRRNIIVM